MKGCIGPAEDRVRIKEMNDYLDDTLVDTFDDEPEGYYGEDESDQKDIED